VKTNFLIRSKLQILVFLVSAICHPQPQLEEKERNKKKQRNKKQKQNKETETYNFI
jgi:hypothetical protein